MTAAPVIERVGPAVWSLRGIHLVRWRGHGYAAAYVPGAQDIAARTVWGAASRTLTTLRRRGMSAVRGSIAS